MLKLAMAIVMTLGILAFASTFAATAARADCGGHATTTASAQSHQTTTQTAASSQATTQSEQAAE